MASEPSASSVVVVPLIVYFAIAELSVILIVAVTLPLVHVVGDNVIVADGAVLSIFVIFTVFVEEMLPAKSLTFTYTVWFEENDL